MKKLLVIFLVFVAAISLCSCTGQEATSSASPSNNRPNSVMGDVDASETSSVILDVFSSTETSSEADVPDTKPSKITGLYVFCASSSDNFQITDSIYRLDVETGVHELVASWNTESLRTENCSYELGGRGIVYYSNYRHWFFEDYKRLVATKTLSSTNEKRAGWLNTDGSFFDVSEAVGLAREGDFSDPSYYCAVGFYEKLFVFCSLRGNNHNIMDTFYYVPMNDISPDTVKTGNPFESTKIDYVSDWIDDVTCIIDNIGGVYPYERSSSIYDVSKGEYREYIPQTSSRSNWSGVISPDGASIAFFSRINSETDPPGIYITSINGGDPLKIGHNLPIFIYRAGTMKSPNPADLSELGTFCSVIDWK